MFFFFFFFFLLFYLLYFLDFFLFFFPLSFILFLSENSVKSFFSSFLDGTREVFSYSFQVGSRRLLSFFTFVFLLSCCFGGYFSYSFVLCGMFEFTFFYAVVAWMSALLMFVSSEKFSIYISKGGDSYLKTARMLLIELVREFSRPIALTVRLTVNIIVGHLISFVLYSSLESFLGNGFFWIVLFAILIECFVFFIQSYIFSRLIFLYLNEWVLILNLKFQIFDLRILELGYFSKKSALVLSARDFL